MRTRFLASNSLPPALGVLLALAPLVAPSAAPWHHLASARAADDTPQGRAADASKPAGEPAPPLLDENGKPFPPARPKAPSFNSEIAASRFAELAMIDSVMEIALGELVQKQGESATVKDLAKRLVTDHTAIRLILTKAATGTVSTFPSIGPDDQATLDRLASLSGAELDREYLWEQSLRQPRQVAMYRWQYENCDEKRLKQFAVGTLPIIVVHVRVADETHRKVNADEIAIQDKRAEAERRAEQERKQAEATAAAAKKSQRRFKK